MDSKSSVNDRKITDPLDKLKEANIINYTDALECLLVYATNLLKFPDEPKFKKIRATNFHFIERLGSLDGSKEALEAMGFFLDLNGEYYEFKSKMSKYESTLKKMRDILEQRIKGAKAQFESLSKEIPKSFVALRAAGKYDNIGKRNYMEDDEIIVDQFADDKDQIFLGLYDGHGGRGTVDFVVKAMQLNMANQLKKNPEQSIPEAFTAAYLMTDSQVRRQNIHDSGCTSVTCLIRREKEKRVLYVANAGDSRAILCRGDKAIRMSVDHKPQLPEEKKRIEDAGGFVGRDNRVNGILAVSRAFGDMRLKEYVSVEPYTNQTDLTEEDKFIILACDGLWDVVSDQEAVDIVRERLKDVDLNQSSAELSVAMTRIARILVHTALQKESQDNITVIVAYL